MSGTERQPVRRFGLRRAADGARVEELDAFLREVDHLRLTLETDMTLAAAALEGGEPEFAASLIGEDRRALEGFERRTLAHFDTLNQAEGRHPRRAWLLARASTVAVAAGLVGLLAGVVPQVTSQPPSSDGAVAMDAAASLELLQDLASSGSPTQIRAASVALHQQLAGVVARAGSNPEAARQALLLLSFEQSALVGSADHAALTDVLRQSRALAVRIRAALPPATGPAVPRFDPEPASSPSPKATQASPSPKASPSASAKPTPTPSPSATPTASSSPSNPSQPGPLGNPPVAP